LRFLKDAIRSLEDPNAAGKAVPGRPNVRYRLIRRRTSGHGHIVVYEIAGNQVSVLRVYHTAQDWQAKLAAGKTLD
jgi:plasmid stabilization system protein ParE